MNTPYARYYQGKRKKQVLEELDGLWNLAKNSERERQYLQTSYHRYLDLLALHQEAAPDAREALEIGSLFGHTGFLLANEGLVIDGIDCGDFRNPSIIQAYRDFFVVDLEKNFEIPERMYDLVLMVEVVEHLDCDYQELFRKIGQLLRPSGKLILGTPNIRSLNNMLDLLVLGINPLYDFQQINIARWGTGERHKYEFTPAELIGILQNAGFSKIKTVFPWTSDQYYRQTSRSLLRPYRLFKSVLLHLFPFLRRQFFLVAEK